MQEIWKDIKGYEGLYQVSNFGRVKRLSRKVNDYRGQEARILPEIVMKQRVRNNYYVVQLVNNKNRKTCQVHRLVAESFILNNDKTKNIVNHIDYNTKNNIVNNLEWCTQKENVLHSIINMKKPKKVTHSNTGEKYITFRKSKNVYRVIVNKKEYGSFKTLEEAIKKRNEVLNNE